MEQRPWLTLGEAADYLGVSCPALRRWSDQGIIPAIRTDGGHRRFLPGQLDTFRIQSEERPDLGRKGAV